MQDKALAHDRLADQFDTLMNSYDIERRLHILIDTFLGSVDLRGRLILDAGCGTGRGVQRLAARGAHVIALDYGRQLLRYTRARYACDPAQGSVIDLPFATGSMYVVFSSEVIEHTPDPLAAVREMVRVLQVGGYLVLSTPNKLWQLPVRTASALGLRPYDGLENFVTPGELRACLEGLDGTLLFHRGLHLIPFQITPLQGVSRRLDRWGDTLLPLMINQCVCFRKGG